MDNIGFLGGDLRIVKLADLYSKKNYNVFCYGLETAEFKETVKKASIKELIEKTEIIISSIPISKDKKNIYSPFSNGKIDINETFKKLSYKKIIAGSISEEILKIAEDNNIKLIDILNNEALTILNDIPTAEGAIGIAIENTEITLHDSNVLILGFGRIGKILAKMLSGIGANVFCEARKKYDLTWIKAYGYIPIDLKNLDVDMR